MNRSFIENNYLILLNIWKSRFFLIFLPFIFMILFSFFYSFIPEKYEVKSRLLIQDTSELNPLLSDLSINSIQRKTFYYEDILKGDIVLDNALKNIYSETNETMELVDLKKKLRDSLKLKRTSYDKNDKNVFDISLKWHNQDDIIYILKNLNEAFIDQFIAENIEALNNSVVFVGEQLEEKKNEILLSERSIINFKVENKEIASDLIAFNYQDDIDLDSKIMNKEITLLGMEEKESALKEQLLRENPKKRNIENQLGKLKLNLDEYSLKYTNNHSIIKDTKNMINNLEKDLNNISKTTQFTIEEMKAFLIENKSIVPYNLILKSNELEDLEIERIKTEREVSGLKKIRDNLNEKSKSYTDVYIKLRELEQDLKIKREQYDKLLDKEEFIKLTKEIKSFEKGETVKSMNVDRLNVISLKYPRFIYLGLGFVFGFLLVLSSSVLLFFINSNLIKKTDIEVLLDSKIISRIPKVSKKDIKIAMSDKYHLHEENKA